MDFKTKVKRILFRNKKVYELVTRLMHRKNRGGYRLENHGIARLKLDVCGSDNLIVIQEGCILEDTRIRIMGNNNHIVFGENCVVGSDSSFWMEGCNISIEIGEGTTFTHTVHFCAQEDGTKIIVGNDCMFSNNIVVRTSDSHPIYDTNHVRINPPKDVMIGNHVWIAPNSKIMKGAVISDGCIIGSDTLVTAKNISPNCLAVGHPAKVVKENVEWTREKLF